ncbi:MAG TPA: hypothetical protein VIO14_01900, partial [Dehalococcoidia bacterium]
AEASGGAPAEEYPFFLRPYDGRLIAKPVRSRVVNGRLLPDTFPESGPSQQRAGRSLGDVRTQVLAALVAAGR